MLDTVCATANESGRMGLYLLAYLRTGDLNHLRMATNSILRIRALGTKQFLNDLIICGMTGTHPLSDEDRTKLYSQLIDE
jgi:hypothetical protein